MICLARGVDRVAVTQRHTEHQQRRDYHKIYLMNGYKFAHQKKM